MISKFQRNLSVFQSCDAEYDESDVVIFSSPMDATCSFRPGTRFAGPAIRQDSIGMEWYSPYMEMDLKDYKTCDIGDLELPMGDVEKDLDEISRVTREILNDNKELITSKFKEYSIEEYDVERQKEDKIAKQIGIAFDKALTRAYNRNIKQEEKARDEIKELAHTIVNITANEIIILEEEINKIIENKSKNERVIDYIFNRMLSLTFVPKDKIEGLYYKLLNYTRKLNVNLAGKYEKEFIEYYNIDNYVFAEEV